MIVATEEFIAGGGGKIFVRSWRPSSPARAVMAICHGFNSHSGMYRWVGEQCAAQGIATYALDLRGWGKSEGERFFVESFDEYVADLHSLIVFAKTRQHDLPTFLLGHSAGGVTACLYALDHSAEIAGLVSEDFAFEVPAPDFALAVLKAISHLAPHAHSIALKNEDFSRDLATVQAMNEDVLIAREKQTFGTMAAIVRADQRLKLSFSEIKLPVLIIHGTADKATKLSGSQYFHAQVGSVDKTLKLYDGRFHDPLNDLGKEEVMTDLLQWIYARLAPGGWQSTSPK